MMNELEKAKQAVALIKHAIHNVRFAAEEERKITHSKHIDRYYQEALDRLEVKRVGADAYLFRIQTVGK